MYDPSFKKNVSLMFEKGSKNIWHFKHVSELCVRDVWHWYTRTAKHQKLDVLSY